MLDSAKNYSYYLLSNDTIYAYKIKDSIGDGGAIVAESMIDQYLNFEEKVEVNYHALNGRTSYIYAVNKRNNIKTLDHIIPHEIKNEFALSINQDTLQIGDALSISL
ncbi:MAG: hypothetical protein CMO01_12460 [Thalassobius sp.]|nr:hypothetical protein [Thalassovita sp.]